MSYLLKKIKHTLLIGITCIAGLGVFLSLGIDYGSSNLKFTIPFVISCWVWTGVTYLINR